MDIVPLLIMDCRLQKMTIICGNLKQKVRFLVILSAKEEIILVLDTQVAGLTLTSLDSLVICLTHNTAQSLWQSLDTCEMYMIFDFEERSLQDALSSQN